MVNESICCFVRFDERKIFFFSFFSFTRYVGDYNPFYGLCSGFSARLDNERYLIVSICFYYFILSFDDISLFVPIIDRISFLLNMDRFIICIRRFLSQM